MDLGTTPFGATWQSLEMDLGDRNLLGYFRDSNSSKERNMILAWVIVSLGWPLYNVKMHSFGLVMVPNDQCGPRNSVWFMHLVPPQHRDRVYYALFPSSSLFHQVIW